LARKKRRAATDCLLPSWQVRRSRTSRWWRLPAAVGLSLLLHPAAAVIYEARRPPPTPRLSVEIASEEDSAGTGVVTSSDGRLDCGGPAGSCSATYAEGALVTLTATVGEKSTFVGWSEACGPQAYRSFAWLAAVAPPDPATQPDAAAALSSLAIRPDARYPLSCTVVLARATRVVATFGEIPEEVEVAWIQDDAAADDIDVPDAPPERREKKPEPPPPDAPVELAVVELPPEPLVVPTPPPPPPVAQAEKPKPQEDRSRLKSVEVSADNVVEKAPDDAAFLSDKNRDVAEQTVAKETNLEREQKGERAASSESEVKSEELGGEEAEIAQLETSEETALDAERAEETARTGEDVVARGIETGDKGQEGEEGEAGDGKPTEQPGALSMRGIEGRGALGGPVVVQDEGADVAKRGEGGKQGKRGKRGRRGIQTELAFQDYERIVGDDKAAEEVALARRQISQKRGRWEKKLAAVKSSLENFTPEVRTGNQTALKTRAAPFAVYIARMHRRIHELWGFGFLEDLDDKPASNPMNDWTLQTTIEIVINPDGSVDKTNIAKPSGVLPFDVAALDTVLTAGPYEAPPEEIHSRDGKTYVHWTFHRDWRQCGTFGAEPFILTTPPKGGDRGMDDGAIFGGVPRRSRGPAASAAADPDVPAASARANASVAAPDHPEAEFAANLWLTGFTHDDVGKMAKVSAVPFRSGGEVVARSAAELAKVYATLLEESRAGVIKQHAVVSAAGYRKLVGRLPKNLEEGPGDLYLVVRLAREDFTVVLREAGDGSYKAVGFFR
jgi:TonB family protein